MSKTFLEISSDVIVRNIVRISSEISSDAVGRERENKRINIVHYKSFLETSRGVTSIPT